MFYNFVDVSIKFHYTEGNESKEQLHARHKPN